MKPSEAFAQHRDTIRRLVLEHGMSNPRLFGSALHGDDVDGSDLDILVDAGPKTSLFDLARLQLALEDAMGIKVDVRDPEELHRSFRDQVLSEAVPV
jgi:hypothetical protein